MAEMAGIKFFLRLNEDILRYAATEINSPDKYVINAPAKGAAACMHGYVALLGLGTTLMINQIVETIPKRIKNTLFPGL